MARKPILLLNMTLVIAGVAVPIALALHEKEQQRNFRVVRPGVLYRSGQMSLEGLKRVIHEHGIRTVVSLRDSVVPGKPPPDHEEEEYCIRQEMNYIRLTPQRWEGDHGEEPPIEPNVQQFLAVMRDPKNHPVLVHCFAGEHRTGAYTALYRMEFEGWPVEKAMAEMKACGYDNLDNEYDIMGYLHRHALRAGVDSPPGQ